MGAPPRPLPTILGAFLALLGLTALLVGGGLLVALATHRDDDGFLTSPDRHLVTATSALTSEPATLDAGPVDWFPDPGDLTLRVRVTPDGDRPVFVGVADTARLDQYLAGVAHAVVTDLGPTAETATLVVEDGGTLAAPPGQQAFWVASTSGTGTQVLDWDPLRGDWVVAILDADGAAGVAVVASAGVASDLLWPVAIGGTSLGVLLLGMGLALVLAAVGRARRDATPTHPVALGASPVHIEAQLDPDVSRGAWMVKWLLAVPHLIVLAVLWPTAVVVTLVAGVVILFTGRYPRAAFDFVVGVLRWTWRVTYYAFGVLGTDRYPPFTLADDPSYPARLDVAYPQRLSRGLVLVKWWLLAIPHYLVIGLFTGGLVSWTVDVGRTGGAQAVLGGGLIGILVVVAGVVLLVTGRYPPSLFDLLMGLQRWVYRVVAYAGLLTDTYPPFRLDPGGAEPGGGPDHGPSGDRGGDDRVLNHV